MAQSLPCKTSTISSTKHSLSSEKGKSAPTPTLYPTIFQKVVAELMGTYIFVFVGCGAELIYREKPLEIVELAIVWGLDYMVVKYALWHISGCHINPAVTIALTAARRFPLKHVPIYVLAQVTGATLACVYLRVLLHEQADIKPILTQFSSPTSHLQAIAWESTITFILMFVSSGVSGDHRAYKELFGVATGAAVVFNVVLAGQITGASMNPARSIGPAIVSGTYKNLWVYLIGPILGATAGALTYNILRAPEAEKPKESTKPIYNDHYNDLYAPRSYETFSNLGEEEG